MVSKDFNPYQIVKKRYDSNVGNFILNELFSDFNEVNEDLLNDIADNKIAIYTASTGSYDSLKDPKFIDENCDYICFTDNKDLKSDIWDIRYMEDSNLDNNRKAKQYKVFPNKYLPEYKYSFWLDGTFRIIGSIREYISKYANMPMMVMVHPERDSIFDEAQSTYHFSRYPKHIVRKQVEHYKKEGIPNHFGLPALGAIFRCHNEPIIIDLMNQWWEEITKYTNQDQLSFTYLMWKNDFHPAVASEYCWFNEYWTVETNGYQHKTEINDYLTSLNLIDAFNVQNTNYLSKDEIYLLLNDIEALEGEIADLNNVRNFWENKVNELKNSSSWKLTKPLRKLKNGGGNG